MTSIGMERAVPILPVEDLARARRFYVDALGFTVTFESSDDGRTGLLGVARARSTSPIRSGTRSS